MMAPRMEPPEARQDDFDSVVVTEEAALTGPEPAPVGRAGPTARVAALKPPRPRRVGKLTATEATPVAGDSDVIKTHGNKSAPDTQCQGTEALKLRYDLELLDYVIGRAEAAGEHLPVEVRRFHKTVRRQIRQLKQREKARS